jgi:hypothetical protein
MVPPERFATFEDASAFALEQAKAWVDGHLQDAG